MNTSTLIRATTLPNDQFWSPERQTCPDTRSAEGRTPQSEADRVFEARLQWFLALSRAA